MKTHESKDRWQRINNSMINKNKKNKQTNKQTTEPDYATNKRVFVYF